jgi:hypothetical protein
MTTDDLGVQRDIVTRLQQIQDSMQPRLRFGYRPVDVAFLRSDEPAVSTGATTPVTDRPVPADVVAVTVLDTVTGERLTARFPGWQAEIASVAGSPAEARARTSFTSLLHVNLDEWWATELRRGFEPQAGD